MLDRPATIAAIRQIDPAFVDAGRSDAFLAGYLSKVAATRADAKPARVERLEAREERIDGTDATIEPVREDAVDSDAARERLIQRKRDAHKQPRKMPWAKPAEATAAGDKREDDDGGDPAEEARARMIARRSGK